jgi:hypothetical protein
MPKPITVTCLECDADYNVEVSYGPLEGDLDYEYPDTCPSCGADLTTQSVDADVREDFHSDV